MLYINTPPNLYTVHMCRDYTKRLANNMYDTQYNQLQPTTNKLLVSCHLDHNQLDIFVCISPDAHTLLSSEHIVHTVINAWRWLVTFMSLVLCSSCNVLCVSWLLVSVSLEDHDLLISSTANWDSKSSTLEFIFIGQQMTQLSTFKTSSTHHSWALTDQQIKITKNTHCLHNHSSNFHESQQKIHLTSKQLRHAFKCNDQLPKVILMLSLWNFEKWSEIGK